jgi:hypothetical protein
VIVGDIAATLEETLEVVLAVEAERDRLAGSLVDELALVVAHPDLAVRRGAGLEHVQVAVGEDRVAAEHRELHDGVD